MIHRQGLSSRLFGLVAEPLRRNTSFFVFMYVLGVVVSVVELPDKPDAKLYDNLWPELLLDLYVVCAVLALLPQHLRRWVRGVVCATAYVVAIADVFCFWKFGSALTPTMLLLVGETNGNEASEFLSTYINASVILSPVGWLLLIAVLQAATALLLPRLRKRKVGGLILPAGMTKQARPWLEALLLGLIVGSIITSWHNKREMVVMFSQPNIGGIEHELTRNDCAQFYQPIYRLAFSIFSNELASQQVEKLIEAKDRVRIDGCSYRVPNIVLIIGESFGKHHSQQYGYFMPTTPRQVEWEKTGQLVAFSDVVAPWNLTSFVFKNLFSMHVVGEKGEWCDYPLFPELFRKAGYHVTFLTNQFLPKAKEAVYDFSGGFFLNNPKLSAAQFDTRNDKLHVFDEGLLKDYDELKAQEGDHNLTIFHLIGQHVVYRQRSPKDRKHFKGDDYIDLKPNLNARERGILSDYDNAILYNDSIVDQIMQRFEQREAIVIYVPDHGEECYEGDMHFFCRLHSADIDARLAHAEFDIPFWIWCSKKYVRRHPKVFREIVAARHRRFMTDALPHLLVYLAGIHAPDYNSKYNLISPDYDEMRPRILKGTTDYDKLSEK